MKIVSFDVSNMKEKELEQLITFAKRLGIRLVNKNKIHNNVLKMVNEQIEKAKGDLNRDY